MLQTPPILRLENLSPARRFLVGVSGGADSVALLHLLLEADFRNLVVCHLHHGLRGADADGDAAFVETLARKYDLRFEIAHASVSELAKGKSVETAAREARHAFFARCGRIHSCPRVLLAHHADDNAETVLWNLLRGSYGVRGMRSMQVVESGGFELELMRPLLTVRRMVLRQYLEERGLTWREDVTNAEPFTIRNRLRNEAIPLLAEIVGRDPVLSLGRAADSGREQEEILAWALNQTNVLDPQGRLHLPVLRTLPEALRRAAIFRFLEQAGIPDLDRDLIDRAMHLSDTQSPSSVNLPGGSQLRRREGRMFID